jgi:hypothetical protein
LTPFGRGEILVRHHVLAAGELEVHMLNASRNVLVVLALFAIVLFILGIATDVGLIGWVLAILVGAYVVTVLVRQRRMA